MRYWIFTADIHAGCCPGGIALRENDFYRSFQSLCKNAIEDKNCLGIIGGGDLRDKPSIQSKNLDGFNTGLEILHDGGKQILAIVGNHDLTEPTWITAMHHPALKDLSDAKVQEKAGINPEETLALHYKNRQQLLAIFEATPKEIRRKWKTLFLHLALKELSAINQKCETSLEEMVQLEIGADQEATAFIGDVHNYGDFRHGNLVGVYPGSLEMTDRNEGVNGLKSEIYPILKPDFRKFVIHWYPEGKDGQGKPEWERVEVNPRPWYYVKIAKAKKEKLSAELEIALRQVSKWPTSLPGCVSLIVPPKEVGMVKETFSTPDLQNRILQLQVEAYCEEIHGEDEQSEEEASKSAHTWVETKGILPEMGDRYKLSPRAKALLSALIQKDGSTHSPKQDVTSAWEEWKKPIPATPPESLTQG